MRPGTRCITGGRSLQGAHVPVHPSLATTSRGASPAESSVLPLTGGPRRGGERERGICQHTPHPSHSPALPFHLPRATEWRSVKQWESGGWCHEASPDTQRLCPCLRLVSHFSLIVPEADPVCGFRRFPALYRWLTSSGRPLDLWPPHCNSGTGEVWQLRSN